MRRVLGFEELRGRIGRGRTAKAFRTWLWRRTRAGDFPRAVRLGPNSVAWDEAEIDAWLASRPRSFGAAATAAADEAHL